MAHESVWRHCGSCKKPIALKQKYYGCSVSTCKKSAYCSIACFDEHSPIFRHKDAWAEEKSAPLELEPQEFSSIAPRRVAPSPNSSSSSLPKDILIVNSKLKDYIRARSGLNTSASVLDRLSDMVRLMCDRAIDNAVSDNRKTVMDRDFSF